MTDQELKDLVASLALKSDRLDNQIASTNAQLAKTDAKLDKIATLVGGISANQGDVAEEFFYNSLRNDPVIGHVTYERVQAKMIAGKQGKEKEFDIVMVNGSSVALIEVKFKAHLSDLEQAEKQVEQYRYFFPEHKDYAIYSGIAALSMPPNVVDEAHKKGLFVLKQVGDVIEVDGQAMRAF